MTKVKPERPSYDKKNRVIRRWRGEPVPHFDSSSEAQWDWVPRSQLIARIKKYGAVPVVDWSHPPVFTHTTPYDEDGEAWAFVADEQEAIT